MLILIAEFPSPSTIGVIVKDNLAKESRDMGRQSQTTVSKAKEKEESEIGRLTPLIKSLTTEVSNLEQWIRKTTMSSRPLEFS